MVSFSVMTLWFDGFSFCMVMQVKLAPASFSRISARPSVANGLVGQVLAGLLFLKVELKVKQFHDTKSQ